MDSDDDVFLTQSSFQSEELQQEEINIATQQVLEDVLDMQSEFFTLETETMVITNIYIWIIET